MGVVELKPSLIGNGWLPAFLVSIVLGVAIQLWMSRGGVGGNLQAPELSRLPNHVFDSFNVSEVDEHIRVLASDEFEGRGVGTIGEEKSTRYIASMLMSRAFQGGAAHGNGIESFFQLVPLQGVFTKTSSYINFLKADGSELNLRHGDSVALSTDHREGNVLHLEEEEVFFGGYCINASESAHRWNDFDGVDVSGAVVVCLVNQPRQDDSFGGKDAALTYYGRWTYKFEELRRQGAKGALLIHTNESAGYGWSVIGCWADTENVRLDPLPEQGKGLAVRGWISATAIDQVVPLGTAGLIDEASKRGFRARKLQLIVGADLRLTRRFFAGTNVVGVLPATCEGSTTDEEAVILTAHHDHFGIAPDAVSHSDCGESSGEVEHERPEEDLIYNGALDNASGVGKLLSVATFFGSLERKGFCTRRKLVLVTPTAEEAVLLGSSYYAANPIAAPLEKTVAMMNFDGMNIWGETEDVVGLGAEFSDIQRLLEASAEDEGMVVSGDAEPLQGLFYRSDQLPFARAGVPAVKITHGKSYVGKDEGYFDRVVGDYNQHRYHQVDDDYEYIQSHENAYEGATQELKVSIRLLYRLLNGSGRPHWKPEHAFAKAQAELLGE
uniref:Peptidase M28 domain-containing protein n=1 Tax=Rhodosorus marinus TaxID=101924 RepID=A0A7S0BDV0_9RHOD|mmetsp:Transcript_11806/g.17112  ORF Transcript_11806/g.17112 Transcript_11806/m.17112 type:complete len:610 (+) Transcript_11806:209-2038(+)